MSRIMKYNLKFVIGLLLVVLAISPFVYFHFRADDALEYFARDYFILEAVVACVLTLPILLLISFSPGFARCCARDVSRVNETISTARYVSCIVTLVLVMSLVVKVL